MIIISIHIFPHELTEYQRVVESLNRSTLHINTHDIELWPTLNLNPNIIEWNGTPQPQDTIDEFSQINQLSKIPIVNEKTTMDVKFVGVNEHRRNTIEHSHTSDDIIFLDPDLYFGDTLLRDIIIAKNKISEFLDYYIITPSTIRLWDATWDCITHTDYLSESHTYYKNPDIETIVSKNYGELNINPNTQFKWGGGWFNCISAKLLKTVGIPESFVGYGPDDTYVMECCRLMRSRRYRVQQYILTNQVVCEQRTPTTRTTTLKKQSHNFREACNKVFTAELNNFLRKL